MSCGAGASAKINALILVDLQRTAIFLIVHELGSGLENALKLVQIVDSRLKLVRISVLNLVQKIWKVCFEVSRHE